MSVINRMMLQGTTDAADADDAEEGRVLIDSEYVEVLKKRNDIFYIEKNRRLYNIEVAALVIGVIFGAWLSTTKAVKIAPGFYQNILQERTARLLRGTNPASSQEIKLQEELGGGKSHRKIEAETSTGAQSNSFSKADYGKTHKKNNAVLPYVNETVQQAVGIYQKSVTREDDSIVHRNNADKAEDEASLINLGNANKTQGNRADAFSAFRRVLKQNPHNTTALAGMGDLFLYTGLLDSAANFYTAALKENPRNALAHNGLGSVRYYLSVMAANPHFAAARNIQDPARYIRLQYDSAIAEYTNALSLDSSRVDALTNRGVIRDIHGDHAAAIEDYTHAIKIKPAYAEAYSKRAATYKSIGKYKDALVDYSAAINLGASSYEFDPTLHFANAYFGRGNVLYQVGNYEKAIADYDSTLSLSPNHSLAMINKARALGDTKRYDSAIVWYTKAIALLSPIEYNGLQERAYFGRGLMYNFSGQIELALKDFNEAIKLKPDDRYAYLHRGNAYKWRGNYDSAIADYKNALESQKLAAKSCWRIAECYSLKQNKDDALIWLKKAVSNGFRDFAVWKQDKELSLLWNDKEFAGLTALPE